MQRSHWNKLRHFVVLAINFLWTRQKNFKSGFIVTHLNNGFVMYEKTPPPPLH